jgi:hypothetical protein
MYGELKHKCTRCKDGSATQVTLHPGTKRMVQGFGSRLAVRKKIFWLLPGVETRLLDHPARSLVARELSYHDSVFILRP